MNLAALPLLALVFLTSSPAWAAEPLPPAMLRIAPSRDVAPPQHQSAWTRLGHGRELLLHGFRAPSIGAEYRHGFVGLHAGACPTVITQNERGEGQTTWFLKAGATGYVLPVQLTSHRLSSFYGGVSYLRGFGARFRNGVAFETGFRWAIWKGLDARLGIAALVSPGEKIRINPTPGLSWSFE